MPARLKLHAREFDRLCREQGWETTRQRAEALGLDPSTVFRMQAGTHSPGAAFIDACVKAFGSTSYSRLFIREDEEVDACTP